MKGPSGYAVDSITVSFHGNNTTHFDALSHFIFNGHIYNGFPASSSDAVSYTFQCRAAPRQPMAPIP